MLACIFGKRGAGKTVMIKRQIEFCESPVVVLDILGNFSNLPNSYETDSLSDALQKIVDYNVYSRANDHERRFMEEVPPVIVLQPDDPNDAVEHVSALLYSEEGGTLVLDEADGFSYHMPWFSKLIRYGRNKGVHVLTGCRRPAELDRNITAGANCIYIFQTQEPRDIEYFAKTLIGKEQAERLKSLPDYHGLFIDYDKKTIGTFKTDERGAVYIIDEHKINAQGNNASEQQTTERD